MKPLDIRDIAIIDAFPVYPGCPVFGSVLNVGCGEGRLDYHVANMGYKVYATDIEKREETIEDSPLPMPFTRHVSDIFDLSSFPVVSASIVICSQLLEHLKEYKTAIAHLLALTEVRLIITVPHRLSFPTPDHVNFWDDKASESKKLFRCLDGFRGYTDIHEFIDLCAPYSTAISKIRTKPEDVQREQWNYLIIVDKRQDLVEVKK